MKLPRCLQIAIVLLVPLSAYSQNPNPPVDKTLPEGVTANENVVYATREGGREMMLDLYQPTTEGPHPAVVVVHGGGWFKGSREAFRPLAMQLAKHGFVAATVSYRLSGEAKFPAAIDDCKDAVRFLRSNAEEFGIVPDRIGAAGLSAGGHLVALLGTSGNSEQFGDSGAVIQAVIPMGAQTDFLSERIADLSRNPTNPHYPPFLGGTIDEVPDQYTLASPLSHLDGEDPPFLFLTGELDDPSTHAEAFRKRCDALGIDQSLHVIQGAPHGFIGRQPWFDEALEKSLVFFRKHLIDQ